MEVASRIREAIKQTRLAIEDTKQPEPLRFLEHGLESLETALTSLEEDDD